MIDPTDANNLMIFSKSPVNWLTEICLKEHIMPCFDTRDKRTSLRDEPLFEVDCTVKGYKGQEFNASGTARNKKDAKHRASISMLNALGIRKEDLFGIRNGSKKYTFDTPGSSQIEKDGLMPGSDNKDDYAKFDMIKNYIGILGEFCVKNALSQPTYTIDSQRGPPHCPEFTMSCRIDMVGQTELYVVTVKKCGNQKAIRQILAASMLEKLTRDPKSLMAAKVKEATALENETAILTNFIRRFEVPSVECCHKNCEKLFSHEIHRARKNLKGTMVTKLKDMGRDGVLDEIPNAKALALLKDIVKEQNGFGLKCSCEFEMWPAITDSLNAKSDGFRCFSKFYFEDDICCKYGAGLDKATARDSSAKEMILVLAELVI